MARRGYSPRDTEIRVFADEVASEEGYRYYQKMSEAADKPLKVLRRPPPPPANALMVTKAQLQDLDAYIALKEKAAREHRVI
jgi:hypothetical protein